MLRCLFLSFRENFAQVDIFYKSLNYEKISAQEAFPWQSLLGEVGGFIGLLLGASCMTIIEVIDFLGLLVMRKFKKCTVVTAPADEVVE